MRFLFSFANEVVRRFYIGPVIFFLNFFFRRKFSSITFFCRRSSSQKDLSFNFFFSDLDLGAEVNDQFTDQEISEVTRLFHKVKSILFFLGELEIYRHGELKLLNSLLKDSQGLYDQLRDFRKINWIKIKLRYKNRGRYHRIKDHRSLKILKTRYNLRSYYSPLRRACDRVSAYTGITFQELSLPKTSLPFPDRIHCDYFCEVVGMARETRTFLQACLVLASTPPITRDNQLLDTYLDQIRALNPKLRVTFDLLNAIEFLIAQGAIRGYQKSEPWQDQWMKKLIRGAALAEKNSVGSL